MMTFAIWVLLVACAAAFVILLAEKWGAIEWLQVRGSKLVSKMAHCSLCLSWWVCVGITVIVVIRTWEFSLLAVPVCATPITRMML